MKTRIWLAVLLLVLTGCSPAVHENVPTPAVPSAATDELRGVWLSYIELDALLQGDAATVHRRLDAVMDTCVAQGLNTVFYHARAHGDAYYRSAVYPAAAALPTDTDPLAYAIEAAHKRGLTLHAWVNPYRLGTDNEDAEGTFLWQGVRYADPASETARRRILDGVRELLEGYAVDGVHLDDYFYPAGLSAQGETFEVIPQGQDVGTWRRTQVSTLVSALWGLCRQQGRVFGISPPSSVDRCRDVLYADVERWLAAPGYVDYLCPQLYSGFDHATAPFDEVLDAWCALPRHPQVTLYVGLALYKAGLTDDVYAGDGSGEWAARNDILARQVACLREREGVGGYVLFRYDYMLREGAPAREMEMLRTMT